jgi:hypothetical protein
VKEGSASHRSDGFKQPARKSACGMGRHIREGGREGKPTGAPGSPPDPAGAKIWKILAWPIRAKSRNKSASDFTEARVALTKLFPKVSLAESGKINDLRREKFGFAILASPPPRRTTAHKKDRRSSAKRQDFVSLARLDYAQSVAIISA